MKITNSQCPKCGQWHKENVSELNSLWPYDYWTVTCFWCGEFRAKSEDWNNVKETKNEQIPLL